VEDIDVCVRQLLQRAGTGGAEVTAVSFAPVCCAPAGAADSDMAAATALLEPAIAVPSEWPEEKEVLFKELLDLHFSPVRARKAIDVGGAANLEEAVVWLERHQNEEHIDTPLEVLHQRDAAQLALDVLRIATVPAVHRLQCFRTLHEVLGKILQDPDSERLRKLRVHNAAFRERILRFPPAVALLRSIGFVQGDYWTSASQRELCLEFRLPVDSDNPASVRFIRAFSLIDLVLSAPEEWLPMAQNVEAQAEVKSDWAQALEAGRQGEAEPGVRDESAAERRDADGRLPREYIAELHERRARDPRGFQESMLAAGKQPNRVKVDVRKPAAEDPSEANAVALSSAASSSADAPSSSYRRLSDRFGGRRHFDLKDIEAMRVEDAIAGCPQYAEEYYRQQASVGTYLDLVTRSYDPQYLGRRAIDDTNIFRGQQHMPPLRWSQALHDIAAEHARQMARGEMPFSHAGFSDRVARYPFPHLSAAENIAYNGGVADAAGVAVQGWINSPGHRKNLLGAFDLCGIGVGRSADGHFYFTQLFARTLGGALC